MTGKPAGWLASARRLVQVNDVPALMVAIEKRSKGTMAMAQPNIRTGLGARQPSERGANVDLETTMTAR